MSNPLDQIAAHVVRTRTEDLPEAVIDRVKTFLLDTFGVGIAGSSGAGVSELIQVAREWGQETEASVLGSGDTDPEGVEKEGFYPVNHCFGQIFRPGTNHVSCDLI